MTVKVTLDHCVVHVSDWTRSKAFYRDVLGAEILDRPNGGFVYRFGDKQLNLHRPAHDPAKRNRFAERSCAES
jgi:catechol 2,3-dioxygenase-like lactoylglutathione lyase family enzyme